MTLSFSNPREIAWRVMRAALTAVDPATAVKRYFETRPALTAQIQATAGRVLVIGGGKAGAPMAAAVSEMFADRITAGHIIVKYGYVAEGIHPNIRLSEAGHPLPDAAGWQATQETVSLLTDTTTEDTVICLISGGGSALLTLPVAGITLGDIQQTTEHLLAAGATINQVNVIRKHLSQLKGGGLARLAAPATLYTLILSDVVADPLPVIASGPTAPDPSTFAEAWDLVEQFDLTDKLPPAVTRRLRAGRDGDLPDTPKAGDPIFERVHNEIVGSNRIAAQAAVQAAQEAGFSAQLLTTFVEGEAREVAKVVAGLAKGLAADEGSLTRPACLVLGGETTVTLRGEGSGGRNQEMALACALALAGWPNLLVACLGTDGSDGPTDAAGAFADGQTVVRARAAGLEPLAYLNRNDAYTFFQSLDDLIITGPTNTNVNDLVLIFAW